MKKCDFIKATYHQGNEVREFNGILIRHKMWDRNPWQIVDHKDFDRASIKHEFYLREDLWKFIKENYSI